MGRGDMGNRAHHLIVGASAAGVAAAFALRDNGFTGRVTLVEAGDDLPYERPPLSKALGGDEGSWLRPIVPAAAYATQDIALRLRSRVTSLDPDNRTVRLADDEILRVDRVLLATGVSARRLPVPGHQLGNCLTLRDAGDARRLVHRLRESDGPLVVVGGGFIGMELAAAARELGRDVTVLEAGPAPLGGALGERLSGLITALHRAHGTTVRTSVPVAAFSGSGTVEAVLMADGTRLPAATVVMGVGVTPNDGLAARAGVSCADGIEVDLRGRTSHPWVYAAGDVARQPHPHLGAPARIEHWDNAQKQGAVVGAVLAGRDRVHDDLPYFWSEQYGLLLQMFGRPRAGDELLMRPDATPQRFLAVWRRAGVAVATAGLDTARDVAAARRLVQRRQPVPHDLLDDPATDLRAVARSRGGQGAGGAAAVPAAGTAAGA